MEKFNQEIDVGVVKLIFSDASDGDFRNRAAQPDLDRRRAELHPAPWTWLRQVHGADLVTVCMAGEHAGVEADGALTFTPGAPLSIATADCAPVALIGTTGFALVHAGWRGLKAGLIGRAVEALVRGGAMPVTSILGPCISPEVYQFSPEELSNIEKELGQGVRGLTAEGEPALDLPTAVMSACDRSGWPPPSESPCTSDSRWFSHRVRGDVGRQVALAWLEGPK